MTCAWCHEFCPPKRKDGFCSDICKEWMEQSRKQYSRNEDAHKTAEGKND